MDRLTERDFNFTSDFVARHLDSFPIAQCLSKLQDYENTEDEQFLIPLSCKLGDTVYTIFDYGEDNAKILTYKVLGVSTSRIVVGCSGDHCSFSKSVFLTKEDAEIELAEIKKQRGES